jgi:hypothetical protein
VRLDGNGNLSGTTYTVDYSGNGATYQLYSHQDGRSDNFATIAAPSPNGVADYGRQAGEDYRNQVAPNSTTTTNTGQNLATTVVAGAVVAAPIPGTLAGGGGAAGELIAAGARAGAIGAAVGVVLSIPGDTYRNPNLVSFRRYDYVAAAPLYALAGRNIPKTFAAPLSDPLVSSSEAQKIYALPGAPRDAYYIITIDPRDNPYLGPTIVQPKYGQPGGGNEVIILGPIPPGQIQGPYPLPPNPDPTKP